MFNFKFVDFVDNITYKIFGFSLVLSSVEGIKFSLPPSQMSISSKGGEEKPQTQPRWAYEEQVLLVAEYFKYKNSSDAEIEKSNQFVSDVLRKRGEKLGLCIGDKFRNARGIQLQRENLSHFDPEYTGDITGHESKWMREIIEEYMKNPEEVKREAYNVVQKYCE